MQLSAKHISLKYLLLFILLTWTGLELFWLPYIHQQLSQIIKERIITSDQIASMQLTENKYPQLLKMIGKNIDRGELSQAEVQTLFTTFISTTANKSNVALKSLTYLGSDNQGPIKKLKSRLDLAGSLKSVKQFLSTIENDTRIIHVSKISLTTHDTTSFVNNINYNMKVNLTLSQVNLNHHAQ